MKLVFFLGRFSKSFTRIRLLESSSTRHLWSTEIAKSSSSESSQEEETQESNFSMTTLSPLVTAVNNLYSRDLSRVEVIIILSL